MVEDMHNLHIARVPESYHPLATAPGYTSGVLTPLIKKDQRPLAHLEGFLGESAKTKFLATYFLSYTPVAFLWGLSVTKPPHTTETKNGVVHKRF